MSLDKDTVFFKDKSFSDLLEDVYDNVTTKRSQIDIIQAVGRAIRKSEKKKYGIILIPVFVENDQNPVSAFENSAFKPVWDVLNALKSHDESLSENLNIFRNDPCIPDDGYENQNWKLNFLNKANVHIQKQVNLNKKSGNIFLTNIQQIYPSKRIFLFYLCLDHLH